MSESSRPPGGLVPGYEIGAAIGKGGFAIVYRARQVSLDRDVAVKIDSRVLDDDRNRRRFLREATASAQVSSHPHVVSLIDAGTTRDNRPYLVMELCDNGSVGQLVKRNGAMPAADVVELGIAISGALAAAHERGILHRDIKPSNILIDPYGTPRLGDFGLAALSTTDGLSVTLEALTPAYAAPEAFEQAAPSKRADVWALGATLYSVLTGIAPRHGDDGTPQSVAEIIQTLYRPLAPVAHVQGADALMSVIWRATAPQKEQRFADAGELHAALLELRGQFGRPHNVLAGSEVTRMTPGQLQAQRFPLRALPSPTSGGRSSGPGTSGAPLGASPAGRTVGLSASGLAPSGASPVPRRPNPVAALVAPTRPRRAWPVVVTSLAVVGLAVGGAVFAQRYLRPDMGAQEPPAATHTVGNVAPTDPAATPPADQETEAPPAPVGSSSTPSPTPTPSVSFVVPVPVCFGSVGEPGAVADPVACDRPHLWEAFAAGTMGDGLDSLADVASDPTVRAACTPEVLARYTDEPVGGFQIKVLPPERSAFETGSRLFYCVASDGRQRSASIKR